MKKSTTSFLGVGVVLMAINLFLTFHVDSEISRTSFISKWFKATTEDLTETLVTNGVVTPAQEHPVYYNPEQGGFKEFHVSEGDVVQVGTRLYEYNSVQLDADRQRIETEKEKLTREVALISSQIKQLKYLQTVMATTEEALAAVTIEKEIHDKEQEQSRLLEDIDDYDRQLRTLASNREIDYVSSVNGIVKKVQYDLSNPIMTIVSETPIVSGQITEVDLAKMEEGMEAYVRSDSLGRVVRGRLSEVSTQPVETPKLDEESYYPFKIALDANEEEILHGAHVQVAIVTNKVEQAVTIADSQLEKGSYLFVLNRAGAVERREVELGLEANDKMEVVAGLEADEIVVESPRQVARRDEPFITSLLLLRVDPEWIKAMDKLELLKLIGVGFSKR